MSYQVLARKWRPGKFSELVGQQHVVNAISNALDNNRLHHAYLFTGTRGVGKTTIARIFARSLNCDKGMSSNPCGVCSSCKDIEQGNFVDLLEIDAASRTKVEDTRELLDNVQYRPTRGDYKVYLIDEVHMLSKHSFNALLKTLEEPPPHVKFLLATTDPQKLPITILSRCLQFNLKALTREQISGQLSYILQQESLPFDEQALALLAKSAHGSMRDALSLTDQAIAQGNGEVRSAVVTDMLGLIDNDKISRIIHAILKKEKLQVFQLIEELALCGADFKSALSELMSVFHQVALTQFVPEACKLETTQARLVFNWARSVPPEQVQLLYQIALQGRKDIDWAQEARIGFEMTVLRMLAFTPDNIAANLDKFKTSAHEAAETISNLAVLSAPVSAVANAAEQLPETQVPGAVAEKKTLTQPVEVASETSSVPDVPATNTTSQEVISDSATSNVEVAPIAEKDITEKGITENDTNENQGLEPAQNNPESLDQDSDAQAEALQSEVTGILAQAESLRPQSNSTSDETPAELGGEDSVIKVAETATPQNQSEATLAEQNPVAGDDNPVSDYTETSGYIDESGYAALDYESDTRVDDYQMLSQMGEMSDSYSDADISVNAPSPASAINNSTTATSSVETKKSSTKDTLSLLELMGTLSKVTEEEKSSGEKPTSYQSEKAPRESHQALNVKDSASEEKAEVENVAEENSPKEQLADSVSAMIKTDGDNNAESAVYQDDILQSGVNSTSVPASASDEVLAKPVSEPHISDNDVAAEIATAQNHEHVATHNAPISAADTTEQNDEPDAEALFSAESFVHEHPETHQEESEQQHHLQSAAPDNSNFQAQADEANDDEEPADYGVPANYDDLPWDSDQESNGQDRVIAETVTTETDAEEDEEDYHELFAGPIPKVSVDFEIPFKVNNNKVVKASQLDTWSQLIEQSGIGGLNKQLALHSNYVLQGDDVKLMVSEHQRHLFTDTALSAIEEALSETLQHDVRVSAHIGEVIDTPAAVQYAIDNMRQQRAEQTIHEDEGVKALCNAFSGAVLNETIEPR